MILRVESVIPNIFCCCIESLSCPNGLKPSLFPGIPLALKRSEVFLWGLILCSILDGFCGEPMLKPCVPSGVVESSPTSLSSSESTIESMNGRICPDRMNEVCFYIFCFICWNDPRALAIQAHNRKLDASRCSGSDVRCGGLGGKQLQEQIVGKLSI